MFMKRFVVLYVFLFSTLCFGDDYWILLSADCQARVVAGDPTEALNELTKPHGACDGLTVALDGSILIMARVKSKHVLEIATIPAYYPDESPLSANNHTTPWFSFGTQFKEVDHSFVLGSDCYYDKETISMFIDMRILHIVAECQFQKRPVGAIVRSVIRNDGIVNTPPGPLVYFNQHGYRDVTAVPSFTSTNQPTDPLIVRYGVRDDALHCVPASLHKINTTGDEAPANEDYHNVKSIKLFVYSKTVNNIVVTAIRRYANGTREFHVNDTNAQNYCEFPTPDVISSPNLVFATKFSAFSVGASNPQPPKLLIFTQGHRERDTWDVEYESQLGNPLACPNAEAAVAEPNPSDRAFYLIYTIFGVFVALLSLQASGVGGVLVYYLIKKKAMPKSKQK